MQELKTILLEMNKNEHKICVVCLRPFTWRKKWRNSWNEVKYCSKKCSSQKNKKRLT